MAPRSLAAGDYRMVGATRSSSDPNAWYRVLHDINTPRHASGAPKLSCDCVEWIRARRIIDALPPAEKARREAARAAGQPMPPLPHNERTCKHTDPFAEVIQGRSLPEVRSDNRRTFTESDYTAASPLLQAIEGAWFSQERIAPLIGQRQGREEREDYRWFLLHVRAGAIDASGMVALPVADLPRRDVLLQQVSAWNAWMVAAEFAYRGGYRIAAPPAHFVAEDRHQGRARPTSTPGAPTRPAQAPQYGIGNLMAASRETNLGDGLNPQQRAEALLQMFLGQQYMTLRRQGYLDISSANPSDVLHYIRSVLHVTSVGRRAIPHTARQLVYRLRLDPRRDNDKRIRVWCDGEYLLDLCVVRRDWSMPVQDAYLSIFLGLLSNERHILQVVGGSNVFGPKSDGYEDFGPAPEYRPRMA